ncbi:MAG: HdeD family acid-resistance protein [Candidatus Velthaea sp.]|jgi:uncharacterized membrane protein HdeD (DUF308 family)
MTESARNVPTAPFDAGTLEPAVRRGWWLFLVRGLLALAVGLIAIFDPGATLAALILLLGAFFIVDGVFAVIKAFGVMRSDRSWWLLLLSGIVSIIAGFVVFAWPGLTALTLGYLVGFWAIVTGIFEIMVAISLRRVIRGEWLYVLFGAISIVFGVYVAFIPGLGLTYLTLMIAIYGFVAGFSLIAAAFRLRSVATPR